MGFLVISSGRNFNYAWLRHGFHDIGPPHWGRYVLELGPDRKEGQREPGMLRAVQGLADLLLQNQGPRRIPPRAPADNKRLPDDLVNVEVPERPLVWPKNQLRRSRQVLGEMEILDEGNGG